MRSDRNYSDEISDTASYTCNASDFELIGSTTTTSGVGTAYDFN